MTSFWIALNCSNEGIVVVVEACQDVGDHLLLANRVSDGGELISDALHLGDVGSGGHGAFLGVGKGDPEVGDARSRLRRENHLNCRPYLGGRFHAHNLGEHLFGEGIQQVTQDMLILCKPCTVRRVGVVIMVLSSLVTASIFGGSVSVPSRSPVICAPRTFGSTWVSQRMKLDLVNLSVGGAPRAAAMVDEEAKDARQMVLSFRYMRWKSKGSDTI